MQPQNNRAIKVTAVLEIFANLIPSFAATIYNTVGIGRGLAYTERLMSNASGNRRGVWRRHRSVRADARLAGYTHLCGVLHTHPVQALQLPRYVHDDCGEG